MWRKIQDFFTFGKYGLGVSLHLALIDAKMSLNDKEILITIVKKQAISLKITRKYYRETWSESSLS